MGKPNFTFDIMLRDCGAPCACGNYIAQGDPVMMQKAGPTSVTVACWNCVRKTVLPQFREQQQKGNVAVKAQEREKEQIIKDSLVKAALSCTRWSTLDQPPTTVEKSSGRETLPGDEPRGSLKADVPRPAFNTSFSPLCLKCRALNALCPEHQP